MRKAQKEQLLDLLATLAGAHKEILLAMDDKNFNLMQQLLGDCQNAAIQIGTMIEESAGENFVTVEMLEEYCELVYQIHKNLSLGQADVRVPRSGQGTANVYMPQAGENLTSVVSNPRKLRKILQKHLVRIENSVKNDIPMRTEAVFLPYKASMWDSLESVWKAADADPDCDAYVGPMPYYDKNPDGTLGEMHDESTMYPNYIPVVNYNEYDFETRRPDMIFIHNPYDDSNYVTSVHPFFYSENLKKYTDCLIYIPYFIEKEYEPGNEKAMGHMEHFVLNPGVIRANYVIVQSEAMRQIYIDILTRHSGEATRSFWEGRVLGLGSPKMDKVLAAREEDFEIPEDWKWHIYKNYAYKGNMCKNGLDVGETHKDNVLQDSMDKYDKNNRRKVIFYNTSISSFLQHGEKMLKKMRDVFWTFKQERENITLLWRPHPLLAPTIRSMRPELYEEYEKIVEDYCTEDWGIYDDSADLNRAIAISDAYYGDPSSVVELFKKVGKPVMIQNPDAQNSLWDIQS